MTKLDWDKADEYQPDPGAIRRDPGDARGQRTLDELIQLASILEPTARQVQKRLESGAKVYAFERNRLDDWNRLVSEIARRQGL